MQSNYTKYIIPASVVAVILIAAVLIYSSQQNQESTASTTQPTQSAISNSDPDTASEKSIYEDGTYEATGNYVSPGGPREIEVSVTLENGVIVASEFEGLAEDPTSIRFQGEFADNYEEVVIGQRIDELELDKVSGSSLTPQGFNDALEQIRTQAQS